MSFKCDLNATRWITHLYKKFNSVRRTDYINVANAVAMRVSLFFILIDSRGLVN